MKRNKHYAFVLADSLIALTIISLGITFTLICHQCLVRQSKKQCIDLAAYRIAKDGRVTLVIENEMMKDFLTKNVLGKIEEDYVDLGFPKFRIHPFVDESASEARIKELKAKHEADDAALAAKAMEQIKKNNVAKKKKQQSNVASADGPVQLGRVINDSQEVKQMKDLSLIHI